MKLNESTLRKIISEAIKSTLLSESIASSFLKKKIASLGGLDTSDGHPIVDDADSNYPIAIPGIFNNLTDEDLLERAVNAEEYDHKIYVKCNNGTLSIPVSYEELSHGQDDGAERNINFNDKFGGEDSKDGAKRYQSPNGEAYDAAISDFKFANDNPGIWGDEAHRSFNDYKASRQR